MPQNLDQNVFHSMSRFRSTEIFVFEVFMYVSTCDWLLLQLVDPERETEAGQPGARDLRWQ